MGQDVPGCDCSLLSVQATEDTRGKAKELTISKSLDYFGLFHSVSSNRSSLQLLLGCHGLGMFQCWFLILVLMNTQLGEQTKGGDGWGGCRSSDLLGCLCTSLCNTDIKLKYWLNCSSRQAAKLSLEVQLWGFLPANKSPWQHLPLTWAGDIPSLCCRRGTGLLALLRAATPITPSVWGVLGFWMLKVFFFFFCFFFSLFHTAGTSSAPLPFPWIIQIAISFAGYFCCDLWIVSISDTLVGILGRIKQ